MTNVGNAVVVLGVPVTLSPVEIKDAFISYYSYRCLKYRLCSSLLQTWGSYQTQLQICLFNGLLKKHILLQLQLSKFVVNQFLCILFYAFQNILLRRGPEGRKGPWQKKIKNAYCVHYTMQLQKEEQPALEQSLCGGKRPRKALKHRCNKGS